MKEALAWLATAATLTFAVPGAGGQNDPRLPLMFERLKTASDAAASQAIEQEIWAIWHVSGDEKVDALMALGLRAMMAGNNSIALTIYDEMVKIAPRFAEAWNKRATVHYLMGRHDESADDIERTLALEPRHFGALSGLGLIRLVQGRESTALAAFDRALAVHPNLAGRDTHIKDLRNKLRGKET